MSDITASSSLKHDLNESPDGLDFSSLPPIFVLSTHLELDALHLIEEDLVKRNARLTYDVSEARLVLGRIGQKKRAALELRSRGVWTEEVSASASAPLRTSPEPPVKRRRVDVVQQGKQPAAQLEDIDLATETEDEEDGMRSLHDTRGHLRRPRSVSPDTASVASTPSLTSSVATALEDHEQGVVVTVVKLDWFSEVLRTGTLVPLDPFVVYRGRRTAQPASEVSVDKSKGILGRAKQDAMARPAAAPPTSRFASRRSREPHDGPSSQGHPPKLYRQTTSEHDEAVPLPPPPDWVRDRVIYACMRSAPLHPPNEAFITQLVKIRKIRELTLDEIGVRAYSTSIASLAAYPYQIRRPSEILTLPGCDSKIAALFAEFKASEHGTLAAAAALDTDPVLKTLHLFWNIWGVGAKTARDFYYKRQWRDLDDIIEHGWDSLSRVQQIGLKYYDEFLQGVPRPETEAIAATITQHANRVRPHASYDGRGVECVIVGGYRRGKELSGDVDLVLSHRDESVTKNLVVDLVASLEAEGWITHTLALHMTTSNREQQPLPFRGDDTGRHFDTLDKALVVWQDPHFEDDGDGETPAEGDADTPEGGERQRRKRNPNVHRRVDIIISPWRTVGCAVLGWSGDTTFERDLRRYAKKAHGWKFDSSGVRERTSGGQVIDLERGGETWEERERLVLEGLGVGWRPPQERCTR
jgi:DNA polymerase IV